MSRIARCFTAGGRDAPPKWCVIALALVALATVLVSGCVTVSKAGLYARCESGSW